MTTVARCPECDSCLPEGAPEGLCPRCLFDVGLAVDGELAPSNVTSVTRGADDLPPGLEHLGPLAERFHDLTPIGRGGMGAVYRARDSRLGRTVAIKVLRPELLLEDATFAGRFEREAQALARLDHPNIVKVHDAGQKDGLYYLVMEHVDGGSLRRPMLEGPIPPHECGRILSALCDAVAYAHAAGVIHRDIKPENVLLDRLGRVHLADFGLAKVTAGTLARSLTGSGEAMGTPCYMAPEQLRDPLAVDHRADIYAIGVLAYEMLTASLPIGRFPEPSGTPGVGPSWDAPILCALSREPAHRFPSVNALRDAFEGATRTRRVARPAPAPTPPEPARPWRAAVVLLGLALVFGPFGILRGIDGDGAYGLCVGIAALVALAVGRSRFGRYGIGLPTFAAAAGLLLLAAPSAVDHIAYRHEDETLAWGGALLVLGGLGFAWRLVRGVSAAPAPIPPPAAPRSGLLSCALIGGALLTVGLCVLSAGGAALRSSPSPPSGPFAVHSPSPPPALARPAPSDPRLSPRPEGAARCFYVERYEDNFLTRRVVAADPQLAARWEELVDVTRRMKAYRESRGELGSTVGLSAREVLESYPSPRDEEMLARGKTTVVLERVRRGPEFTREDRDALRLRLARFPEVRVVLVEEVTPPSDLTARDDDLEPVRERLAEGLPRAIAAAPIEEWEAYLGQRLHVGDIIESDPSQYRGVWSLIVGERRLPGGRRVAVVVDPYQGGEFYVTPPAYLSCPGRMPFGYWSGDAASYAVDCFPLDHAWLREHVEGSLARGSLEVLVGDASYPVSAEVWEAATQARSPLQVYVNPEAGELLLYERSATLGRQ